MRFSYNKSYDSSIMWFDNSSLNHMIRNLKKPHKNLFKKTHLAFVCSVFKISILTHVGHTLGWHNAKLHNLDADNGESRAHRTCFRMIGCACTLVFCRIYWFYGQIKWIVVIVLRWLKELLLMTWCHIPQDTFREIEELMLWRIRAGLAAQGKSTQY